MEDATKVKYQSQTLQGSSGSRLATHGSCLMHDSMNYSLFRTNMDLRGVRTTLQSTVITTSSVPKSSSHQLCLTPEATVHPLASTAVTLATTEKQ